MFPLEHGHYAALLLLAQVAFMIITVVPRVIISAPTPLTSEIPEYFKSAKSDALALLDSDGKIRGAQFEQVTRQYCEAGSQPLIPDNPLALAIATPS